LTPDTRPIPHGSPSSPTMARGRVGHPASRHNRRAYRPHGRNNVFVPHGHTCTGTTDTQPVDADHRVLSREHAAGTRHLDLNMWRRRLTTEIVSLMGATVPGAKR